MLHSCNTPIDLSYRVVVFCCFCATLPDYVWHFCNTIRSEHLKSHLRSPVSRSQTVSPTFEGLWISLNALTPLSLIEAIEPHWSPTVPLNPLNRSYSRNLMLDSRGSVRSVPKYSNWTHTDVLGTWLSTCSDRCPPWRPPSSIFNTILRIGQCVNQKMASFIDHYPSAQHVVVATVTQVWHRSLGQD